MDRIRAEVDGAIRAKKIVRPNPELRSEVPHAGVVVRRVIAQRGVGDAASGQLVGIPDLYERSNVDGAGFRFDETADEGGGGGDRGADSVGDCDWGGSWGGRFQRDG